MDVGGHTNIRIIEERAWLGPAPALLVHRGDPCMASSCGTILFYHGLGASKEANRAELHSLAEHGYLAVGIDNVGHGERRYPDFDRRFAVRDAWPEVIRAVEATAREVPAVCDALRERGLARNGLGVAGISMGGFIVYGALLAEPRLQVATPILGSPRWWEHSMDSPHRRLDRFYPRAILSQNAGRDANVPPTDARRFHQALAEYYADIPDRHRYVEFEDAEHFMPEHQWRVLWQNVLAWFDRFLRPA